MFLNNIIHFLKPFALGVLDIGFNADILKKQLAQEQGNVSNAIAFTAFYSIFVRDSNNLPVSSLASKLSDCSGNTR